MNCKMVNCYDMIPNSGIKKPYTLVIEITYIVALEIFDPMKMLYEDVDQGSFEGYPMYL